MSTSSGAKSIQGGLNSQTIITECPLELFSSSGQSYSVLLDISRNISSGDHSVCVDLSTLSPGVI